MIGPVDLNVNQLRDTNSILRSRPNGASSPYRSMHQETVQSVTIDHFAAAHDIRAIDILKMDIQGAELRALRGVSGLLRDQRIGLIYCEVLFRELYDQQPLFQDIATFLQDLGYRLINFYDCVYNGGEMQWADAIFAGPSLSPGNPSFGSESIIP